MIVATWVKLLLSISFCYRSYSKSITFLTPQLNLIWRHHQLLDCPIKPALQVTIILPVNIFYTSYSLLLPYFLLGFQPYGELPFNVEAIFSYKTHYTREVRWHRKTDCRIVGEEPDFYYILSWGDVMVLFWCLIGLRYPSLLVRYVHTEIRPFAFHIF